MPNQPSESEPNLQPEGEASPFPAEYQAPFGAELPLDPKSEPQNDGLDPQFPLGQDPTENAQQVVSAPHEFRSLKDRVGLKEIAVATAGAIVLGPMMGIRHSAEILRAGIRDQRQRTRSASGQMKVMQNYRRTRRSN